MQILANELTIAECEIPENNFLVVTVLKVRCPQIHLTQRCFPACIRTHWLGGVGTLSAPDLLFVLSSCLVWHPRFWCLVCSLTFLVKLREASGAGLKSCSHLNNHLTLATTGRNVTDVIMLGTMCRHVS